MEHPRDGDSRAEQQRRRVLRLLLEHVAEPLLRVREMPFGGVEAGDEGQRDLRDADVVPLRDLEEVAYGECGEGMDWAMQLINDVHYRMGRYFQWKGDDERARASFAKYLHNRSHGVGSIYDRKPVEEYLAGRAARRADVVTAAKRNTKT